MSHVWTPRWGGGSADTKRCRASVTPRESGGGFHSHQCHRAPTVWRCVNGKEYGFCAQHDPVAQEGSRKARHAKWEREAAERNAAWERGKQRQAAQERAVEALRAIEAGHNDPRALAREVLAMLPEEPNVN